MAIVLNLVEFEQVLADLIVDELPIGGVFGAERGERGLGMKAFAPGGVEIALMGDGFEAEVVEQGIEFDFLAGLGIEMGVIAGGGGADGRKGQRVLDELIAEGGELLGGGGGRRGLP